MTDVRTQEAPAATARSRSDDHGSYIWYELMTPDPEGAKAFYAVVGWDIEPQPSGEMDYRMIRRSDGGNAGGVMRLTEDMASHGAKPIWLGYIYVDDVDASVASIERAGGKTYLAAFDIPNIGRIAMVADPQGAPFYVMKPIPPAGRENEKSDVFSPDAEQRCGWNELSTSDAVAALDFYTSQFGWEKGNSMPMGDKGDYQFINRNGQMIGAIFPSAAGARTDEPPHWRYYFRVASIATAKETAEDKGGKIVMGPMEVPGGDHIVIGIDLQGAEFALVGGQ
jgi:predicted enzyme related to lactoylglutathione lyase